MKGEDDSGEHGWGASVCVRTGKMRVCYINRMKRERGRYMYRPLSVLMIRPASSPMLNVSMVRRQPSIACVQRSYSALVEPDNDATRSLRLMRRRVML